MSNEIVVAAIHRRKTHVLEMAVRRGEKEVENGGLDDGA